MEAFDIFSQGEISVCDSCGVNSDCECRGRGRVRLWGNDIHVSPSFAVEVVGDGVPSDSGWGFGSECGSVGETTPSIVTVMCEGVPSDSERDFVEPQSFSHSKKRNVACVENPGRHELLRNTSKGSSLP